MTTNPGRIKTKDDSQVSCTGRQSSFLLASTFLCDSLPHWKSVGLCEQQKTEVVACDFQRKVIKDAIVSASLPPSWMTCSWGKAL